MSHIRAVNIRRRMQMKTFEAKLENVFTALKYNILA
jgi:hypothetical protein